MDAGRLKMMGRGINLVGRVSPRLAGRLAFTLFTRTRNPEPQTQKERALFAESAPWVAQAQRETVEIEGRPVAVHVFPPIGPGNDRRVMFTHGWGSRIALTQGLVTGLRQAGYSVYAIDLPGHGDSPGRSLHAGLAIRTLAAVWQRFGSFDAMIGHSFGGFMTVLAAHGALDGRPLSPPRIVLIASPADVRRVLRYFSKGLGLDDRVAVALTAELERATGRPAEASFGPKYLAASGVPTLVLHASEDKEVGADAARAYAEAGPNVELTWLDGLGHRRIVNSPEAIEAITKFLG
ncbi:alpha/beta hydrolase [Rhizobium sp. C4]|uniref:alpha/beta hydrolase n=1 Tax=Rhizobium sp. C4 TaxID=1349800 RepID=UPI001E419C9A|nr:alpha/beta fold hydrolase [Rhizobium sp. C4]MCD2175253.1 alpha/beta fold hydrolase [Rhizobium sp. C4]